MTEESEALSADYYRERLREVLALAARCRDDARPELLRLATRYERLIERAQVNEVNDTDPLVDPDNA